LRDGPGSARKLPPTMYIVLSKKPRVTDRGRTNRFRAKMKSKNMRRRRQLSVWKKSKL